MNDGADKMKIAIAIPCYNCEVQIRRLLFELDKVLTNQKLISEVYIIENNSTDATLAEAIRTVAELPSKKYFSVYRNLKNIGLGGTHKIAFTVAKSNMMTHLILLHGDHQATANDIPLIIEYLHRKNGVNILGSRFLNLRNLSGYSFLRKSGNLALNRVYSVVTNVQVMDLGSGLNAFRLADFDPEVYQNFDDGFTFNMDLLLYLIGKKIAFKYVPIKWTTVDQISNARALSVGLKTLIKLFRWRFSLPNENEKHFESEKLSID